MACEAGALVDDVELLGRRILFQKFRRDFPFRGKDYTIGG